MTDQISPWASVAFGVESTIPDSGVARYNFEQDVVDTWNGLNGTDNTSAGYITDAAVGDFGKDFDGIDDWIDLSSVAGSGGYQNMAESSFSVAIWVRTNSSAINGRLWEKRSTSNFNRVFSLFIDNGVFANVYSGSVQGTTTVSDGEWHHCVLTYGDGDGEWKLYTDGSLEDTSTSIDANFGPGNDVMKMGTRSGDDGSNSGYFGGALDDARPYTKELTAQEVSDLYSTGSI